MFDVGIRSGHQRAKPIVAVGGAARQPQKPNFRPIALDSAEQFRSVDETYHDLVEAQSIITGTPKTVIPEIRHALEYLRPGSVFFGTAKALCLTKMQCAASA